MWMNEEISLLSRLSRQRVENQSQSMKMNGRREIVLFKEHHSLRSLNSILRGIWHVFRAFCVLIFLKLTHFILQLCNIYPIFAANFPIPLHLAATSISSLLPPPPPHHHHDDEAVRHQRQTQSMPHVRSWALCDNNKKHKTDKWMKKKKTSRKRKYTT